MIFGSINNLIVKLSKEGRSQERPFLLLLFSNAYKPIMYIYYKSLPLFIGILNKKS